MYLDLIESNLREIAAPPQTPNIWPWTVDKLNEFFNEGIVVMLEKAILAGDYYDDADQKITRITSSLQALANSLDQQIVIEQLEELVDSENIGESPQEVNQQSEGQNDLTLNVITDQDWRQLIDNDSFRRSVTLLTQHLLPAYSELVMNVKQNLESFTEGTTANVFDIAVLQGYQQIRDFSEILQANSIASSTPQNIQNYYIFQVTLLLSYIDEYLECKQATLSILKNIKKFLTSLKVTAAHASIVPVLLHKAEFLEYKINYRFCHRNSKNESIGLELPALSQENVFKQFDSIINEHYSSLSETKVRHLESEIEGFKKRNINNVRVEPFHHINRYYSKISTDTLETRKKKIEGFVTLLERKQGKRSESAFGQLSTYDKIAYFSTVRLLKNSLISIEFDIQRGKQFVDITSALKTFITSDDLEPSVTYLDKYITEVEQLSEQHKIPDHYCLWIFIGFLDELIQFIIKNPEHLLNSKSFEEKGDDLNKEKIIKNLSSVTLYIQKLYERALRKLKPGLLRMNSHESKPVYMTKSECSAIKYTWPDDQKETSLYLDSSYVLPTDFKKLKKKLENGELFLIPQLRHLKDALEINLSQVLIEKSISKSEKKAKENEFKVVQIVALFVSIATFVLINVKIFENRSGVESIALMLGIASCFLLFNLFFHFMILMEFREKRKFGIIFREALPLLSLPILFAIVSLIILIVSDYKTRTRLDNLETQIMEVSNADSMKRLNAKESVPRKDSIQKDSIQNTGSQLNPRKG